MATNLLTARRVAEQLAVSCNMVYSLAARGELSSFRIGSAVRFDPADIEAFVAQCRVPARSRADVNDRRRAPTVRVDATDPDPLAMFRRAGLSERQLANMRRRAEEMRRHQKRK